MKREIDFGAAMKPKTKGKSKFLTPARHSYDLEPIKEKLATYNREIDKMVIEAETLEVKDDTTNIKAVEIGNKAKDLWKRIEQARKQEIDEPNKFVHEVNRFARLFQDRLKNIENAAKRKIAEYQYHQALDRREAERKAREEAEKLQAELDKEAEEKGIEPVKVGEMVMPESEKVVRTESGSSYQRTHWTFEIVDAEKIPREYLVPDERKLRQAVAMGLREIPGVKIFEKSSTIFRT